MEGQLSIKMVDGHMRERAIVTVDAPHNLMHHAAQPLQNKQDSGNVLLMQNCDGAEVSVQWCLTTRPTLMRHAAQPLCNVTLRILGFSQF